MEKKKVVVMSGGNGSFITINALKRHLDILDISAVIPMSDSGGSSGVLRKEFDTLPAGDIMRAVLAMSSYDSELLKTIFYRTRFSLEGKLQGHNLGNLFLILAEKYSESFMQSLRAFHESLNTVGNVYPVSLQKTELVAILEGGLELVGEHHIDRPEPDQVGRIKSVRLNPSVEIHQEAARVIEDADMILFGPGSLYCSVIAGLLPKGVKEAIFQNSTAKLVFVSGGAYEIHGERGPRNMSDTFFELESYLPRPLDIIIHNNHTLSRVEEKFYDQKGWAVLQCDKGASEDERIISADFEKKPGGLDFEKLSMILKNVII